MTFVLPSGTTIDTAEPKPPSASPSRAGARRRPRRDPRRDPRRRRAERAHPPQVRDQEHDRLPALRLPRRRRAAGDLPPPARRLRGHARLRRRGGLRDRAAAARTTTAWIHFPSIDAAIAPVRDLVDAGATAVELMVAPALITAAWNMVGAPEEWKELPPESAVLLVEFGAATDAELDDVRRRRPTRSSPRTSRSGPIDFTRDAGGDRACLAGARGPPRADRQAPAAGHGADHRGRLRAAGADRRVRPRPRRRCSASTASSPGSPATPRPATSTSC